MSSQTRPEFAFDVCQLGTNFKNSGEQDVKYANKVITHLKHDPAQIIYKQLGKDEHLLCMPMHLMETYQMEEVN